MNFNVVTTEEMRRVEERAYQLGAQAIEFMENAGRSIAEIVEQYVHSIEGEKKVFLFVGKGNNGGDALAAGCELLGRGFSVIAYCFYSLEESSSLCKKQRERFKKQGGEVHKKEQFKAASFGVILDGLVGTGFTGGAKGILAEAIAMANQSRLPILAIDIPSGLNGNTGEVQSIAIEAMATIYLGFAKLGFFIGSGWNHVGELIQADFGLDRALIKEVKPSCQLLNEEALSLSKIKRNRHKYEAGYVLALAGSRGMAGAAFLSSFSALRAGAGIVRLFYMGDLEGELVAAPWELLKEPFNWARYEEECERAHAVLIGPGAGRGKKSREILETVLAKLSLPSVIDADGLSHLAESVNWKLPRDSILTPHRREMERLLGFSCSQDLELLSACQHFVEEREVILLLKGGPTFLFQGTKLPLIISQGDPGMATAGSGDVLSGILAGLLAQKMDPYKAATLGAFLHGVAGEIAAENYTSYGMVASDIIKELPAAFSSF